MNEKIKEGRSSDGRIIHYGVGAFIEKDGKYLIINRAVKPWGYGCISEHINEGESAEEAVMRGVFEEAGLNVISSELILERMINSRECSNGKFPHYCYIFRCAVEGEIKSNPKEVKSIDWYSKEDIKKLKLEPFWKFFFKKMNII